MVIVDKHMSKNALAAALTKQNRIYAIADGTQEDLNLLLTSTTFARLFKEVDGVISRGMVQKRRLFDSHFQFTQDIFNIATTEEGSVRVDLKGQFAAASADGGETLDLLRLYDALQVLQAALIDLVPLPAHQERVK